ncbi:hypothetical protein [Campylobacter showae]|nr:hypothetical protein [Campylobacter showae]
MYRLAMPSMLKFGCKIRLNISRHKISTARKDAVRVPHANLSMV